MIKFHNYSHFKDKESGTKMLSDFTQVKGAAEILLQIAWLQNPHL